MKKTLAEIINQFELIDSVLGIIGIILVLLGALFFQFFLHEQPCPLCLLQRVALINIGLALLMNLRYGNRGWHWAIVVLSACAGMAVSTRQILLHITNNVGFGSAIFSMHMYTWCFLIFAAAIIGATVMILIYPEKMR